MRQEENLEWDWMGQRNGERTDEREMRRENEMIGRDTRRYEMDTII